MILIYTQFKINIFLMYSIIQMVFYQMCVRLIGFLFLQHLKNIEYIYDKKIYIQDNGWKTRIKSHHTIMNYNKRIYLQIFISKRLQ